MRNYHFSCGDSTHGPVGLAGSVRARTKSEALLKVRRALSKAVGPYGEVAVPSRGASLNYLNVYLSPQNIRATDIDCEP